MLRALAALSVVGLVGLVGLVSLPGLATASSSASQGGSGTPICGSRTELVGKLKNQYSERPVAGGLATNGGILEVLASPNGNSWTIVLTMPDGTSCLVAAGKNWQTTTRFVAGKGI